MREICTSSLRRERDTDSQHGMQPLGTHGETQTHAMLKPTLTAVPSLLYPDWFFTTEPSEGGRCHFPVGKERIDAPFLRKNDTQVTLAGTSDCLWSPAAFGLLL